MTGPAVPRRRLLGATALVVGGAVVTGFAVRAGSAGPPARTSVTDPPGPVVDVREFGAVGDGRTDDGPALRRGLAAVDRRGGGTGGTLLLPAGTYLVRGADPLRPGTGVLLRGEPGASTILFDPPPSDGFAALCAVDADDVTLDGLVLRRAGDVRTVLVRLGAVSGCTLSRTELAGDRDTLPATDCHGITLPDGGTVGAVVLTDCAVHDLSYGLLMANASTATVRGLTVERCSFTRNNGTDLEFNSPYGSIGQVRVTGCDFSDNDSPGFGVGLAHVTGAVVADNRFTGYALEAVHVEDHSADVTITGNTFTACGLRDHSHVQVISGSTGVEISENTFDATASTNPIHVVNVLPGGTGPTAGGRAAPGPSRVEVLDNVFDCAAVAVPVYFQDVRSGSVTGSTITGPIGPDGLFRLLEDHGTVVTGTVLNGAPV